ncbi:MAG: sigma-70 family RNA polymerase sigma factor [Weeksellaceae bacterium]|nr:sigma-70 family RNA polymerase sigma factor [Weeksellaceae bacterium]
MKSLKDSQLIHHYINGNESALSILIDRHQQRIYSFIYSKVFDHAVADDVFQETFVKVIVTIKEGRYNEEGKFLPWVLRIAYNLTIDHFRSKSKFKVISENQGKDDEFSIFDFIQSGEDNAEMNMIQEQIFDDLKKLLHLLPAEQKEVLELRLYKNYSFKEIAEETDVSINTALGRMRYALINLRKMIEEKNMILTIK